MPRSSRANPKDVFIDHDYEARRAQITLGRGAGAALGAAFSTYLSSGTTDKGVKVAKAKIAAHQDVLAKKISKQSKAPKPIAKTAKQMATAKQAASLPSPPSTPPRKPVARKAPGAPRRATKYARAK
jgi:hypothetical protein